MAVSFTTFAIYSLHPTKGPLTSSLIFTCLSLFNLMSFPLSVTPNVIARVIETTVSVRRLQEFFLSEELDDSAVQKGEVGQPVLTQSSSPDEPFTDSQFTRDQEGRRGDGGGSLPSPSPHKSILPVPLVSIQGGGTFSWSGVREEAVLRGVDLSLAGPSLLSVVGRVGSGKSSLLSALLGEMVKHEGEVRVIGRVAYAPQQAWIMNATLRENITFGNPFDPSWYQTTIRACALTQDIAMLPAGDSTEVGERGITLSGGQKARLSLARAVYSKAQVYFLDDTLSAVDSHVGKHIFKHVIGPQGLLKDVIRIFITHAIHFVHASDQVMLLQSGQVKEYGSYEELMGRRDGSFSALINEYVREGEGEGMDKEEAVKANETPGSSSFSSSSSKGKGRKERGITIPSPSPSSSFSSPTRQEIKAMRSGVHKTSIASVESPVGSLTYSLTGKEKLEEEERREEEDISEGEEEDEEDGRSIHSSNSSKSMTPASASAISPPPPSPNSRDPPLPPLREGRLTQEEGMVQGEVSPHTYSAYFAMCGRVLSIIFGLSLFTAQASSVASGLWLKEWSRHNEETESSSSSHGFVFYLGIYGILCLGYASFSALSSMFMFTGWGINSAKGLHEGMLRSVLRAPMFFFDTTPLGRLLNRFSKDVQVLDEVLPMSFYSFFRTSVAIIGVLGVIIYSTPIFILVLIPLIPVYIYLQRYSLRTSRELKRLDSVSRSPTFAHFQETLGGLTTIRAFSQTQRFTRENWTRLDANLVAYYPSVTLNRWLAVRLELIGAIIITSTALLAVLNIYWVRKGYEEGQVARAIDPGLVGLSVSYALNVTQTLNWAVRCFCDIETNVVSVERVLEYTQELPSEAPAIIPSQRPSPIWPDQGVISFRNYSTRYREGLELVLSGVTLDIQPREKVGIVGRTGAGKSSLTLALFRLIEAVDGMIVVDGVDLGSIGLYDLRSRLTIIPQDPFLFAGTVRENLDPEGVHDDRALWRSLQLSHLQAVISEMPGGLDGKVLQGGDNFSIGQRQLICLARALLRRTSILILDEATAAIDVETGKSIML